MCAPKTPQVKNILPSQPMQVAEAPKPVAVEKDGADKTKRKRNPLRIDLAGGGGGSATTGVNI